MNYNLNNVILENLKKQQIQFEKANINDIDNILNLYVQRMNWFKEKEIKQWSKYLTNHPKEEFIDIIKNGYFFILKQNNEIIAAFEISIDSKFWQDNKTPALYIYKIVTKVGSKNIASYIFDICKSIAKTNNKKYLRIDCLKSNKKLNEIYNNHGFKFVRNASLDELEKYYSFSLRQLDINDINDINLLNIKFMKEGIK